MASLAATLKAELRRQAARETRKALRSLQKVKAQVGELRRVNRVHLKGLTSLKRRFDRLKKRMARARSGTGRRMSGGLPGRPVTPKSIRKLRDSLGLSRALFSKLVGVSPGSIFGWEKGRTVPRGASRGRLAEVRKMGLRAARALVARSPVRKRGARRARRSS